MGERGDVEAEKAQEVDLACTRTKKVPAPSDLRDTHEAIIHDDGELVCEDTVAASDEEVATLSCEDLALRSEDEVLEGYGATRVVQGGHPQS